MSNTKIRRLLTAAGVPTLAIFWTNDASAQYFGRNKVQYKNLDFQILKTEHFDIYFYPSEREGIDISARLAERWNTRLEKLLEHKLRGRQPLVLYASHPDFEQTNAIQGELGEGTGGVTEPLKRRIVLPLGGPIGDTDHVIGHELVHAFQFDITTGPNAGPGENGAERLPLWFIEGMAEYLSLGPVDPNTAMWLRDAVRENKLPTIDELDNPKYFPYRWGQAFWAYVGGKYGDAVIPEMLKLSGATGDTSTAIKRVLGLTTKELSEEWRASIRSTYEPILNSTTPPAEIGRLTIKSQGLGAELNVGPSISPDGRWIAFLSERGVFSIDLYIADASTGKIVHKLTSTGTDPHYSSIQFIYSAGGWSPDSKKVAIATVSSGRPALAIFDAQKGSKEREIPVTSLDEIFNPTWAPDGHAVCFTGMSRGLTDLYVLDLNSAEVKQLTHDAYADLQPAWSPDGKQIAFATDRFSSRLEALDMGPYRLALVDPETGAVTPLKAFTGGKNMNPQWSPDGKALYFLSDRDSIANLYRMVIDSGDIKQMTNVGTGLSGITATSPALSVASAADVAAFSVYEGGKYDVYTLPLNDPALLKELTPVSTVPSLPPLDRKPSDVAAALTNATVGLPPPGQQNEVVNYKPTLGLLAVGQPTIGVGVSSFGVGVGGGISMYFGDMLGNHTLATAVSFNSTIGGNYSIKNTAAQVAYLNQSKRWNWGLFGGQVPYLSGGFAQPPDTFINGRQAAVFETIIFRQTERSAGGLVAYPLSRAQRVEFQGGVTQMSFDQIVQTQAYDVRTGELLQNDSQETSLANPLTLGTTSVAFVSDTSNFGATSPVQGARYRLEASPTFGSINYTGVTLDYRRYFMPASFYTLAVRGMHYGRYGSGGDDSRLFPVSLGYPGLVRGYDVYSFDQTDCVRSTTSTCPAFDRLYGSRMMVGNVEFRFPLLRPFGVSQRMYGPVPVEVAFFGDAGVAWNSLSSAVPSVAALSTTSLQPHPFKLSDGVTSAGVALRVNLFGFAVGEFDFVKPFQRVNRGWMFAFNFTPGF